MEGITAGLTSKNSDTQQKRTKSGAGSFNEAVFGSVYKVADANEGLQVMTVRITLSRLRSEEVAVKLGRCVQQINVTARDQKFAHHIDNTQG